MSATDAIDTEVALIAALCLVGVAVRLHSLLVGNTLLIDEAAGIVVGTVTLLALVTYVPVRRDR